MGQPTRVLHEPISISPDGAMVYGRALRALSDAGVPFLVGGAWAMARLAGIRRYTKDIDLFVRPRDLDEVLATLDEVGFRTEVLSATWLGKAWYDELFVDIIFSSGNGIATVDDVWFEHAVHGHVLDQAVLFCPVEETIWSKAWIMERERYDGADVAHLLRACGARLDWHRLLERFGSHWRVLYGHLVLFGYVYPGERSGVPDWVHAELSRRMSSELTTPPPRQRVCRGPLLSRQYVHDLDELGYVAPDELPTSVSTHGERTPRRRG